MRQWCNRGEDDGSVHAIGNGEMLVYGKGPDIFHLFGPPYSAPSFLSMSVDETERNIRAVSAREKNTAIWHHDIFCEDEKIVRIVDFILPDKNIFIRDITALQDLTFKMEPAPEVIASLDSSDISVYNLGRYFGYLGNGTDTMLFCAPKGTRFGNGDTTATESNVLVAADGNISISGSAGEGIKVYIRPGTGRLVFSGGTHHPAVVGNMEQILKEPEGPWLEQSRSYWRRFASRRLDFASMLPSDYAYRDLILDAIDSVSVLVKCQQSVTGGVMAGHMYAFAYIRDQSGVLRGLLALGYMEEARAILDFWIHKFSLFGNLLDAEGMGNHYARIPWFNDEVELPAYIILDCFKYYEYTQDDGFLRQAFPMMEWAFEVQLKHLVNGMTGFNGDETYIAGRVFDAGHMHDGSAESTLMFITGGEKLLDWAEAYGLWPENKIRQYREAVYGAKNCYKQNFYTDRKYIANNPDRARAVDRPRFRFAFCGAHNYGIQKTAHLTWTEINDQGYYVCPDCRGKALPDKKDASVKYVLNSVSLIPIYIGSDIFTGEEIHDIVKQSVDLFRIKGTIPSDMDGNKSLGYDFGLFLYNMVKLGHPDKEKVLVKVLSVLDPAGAWVEYYNSDKPSHCRCRPWESAINIEAVVEYCKAMADTESENTAHKLKSV